MRIVRLANFVTPRSGGLRTALRELGRGYLAAGHDPVLIVPGTRASDETTPQGRVISLPGQSIPFTGYDVMLARRRISQLLQALRPDSLEVSDRTTLRWTGRWARRHSCWRAGSTARRRPPMTGSSERRRGRRASFTAPPTWCRCRSASTPNCFIPGFDCGATTP